MTEFEASSSCSSPPFTYGWPYHVFLSFRGEDTRYGFTGNLYYALHERGIRTFIDDQGIRKGEEITPTLLKTIKESKTAIVVFSKDYVSSTFCLRELAQILDCMKGHNGRFIWPVFYDVDPSHVRHQKGTYKDAFDRYEGVKDETMVKRWRFALKEVANLSGWHLESKSRSKSYEYEIIEEIIEAVSKEISIVPLHIAQSPIGLESRVEEICSLLNKQPHYDGATMVGIFGLGRIGKTTIAQALYNEIASDFKHICFLDNVKEKHIHDIQKRLLFETVRWKCIDLEDYKSGIPIIKDRLCSKKVLLVLDDIDTLEQLKALAGESNWFGFGSIIIISTRNKSLLKKHGVERIYEAKELNDGEACELLILNAFKTEEVDPTYNEVINRAVKYAKGLPLALEILSSNLGTGQSVKEWETALDIYEKIPEQTIHKILKVSYDGLEEIQREIFLDIACFYKGESSGDATKMLSASHGVGSEFCISMLIDKSLIKIKKYGYFDMHDLIQDMGLEIVRQESLLEAGKRSRLWSFEDIFHVLKENTGTGKIQAMKLSSNMWFPGKVEWSGKSFKKMKNLRVLSFHRLQFSQGPKYLPNSLRVLEWHHYPSSTLPIGFDPINLVILSLPHSCLETLGKPFKNFYNLRKLDLQHSENLKELPNISRAANLEELNVSDCKKLTKIDNSVGRLAKLRVLKADGCVMLDTFITGGIKLISLEILDLEGCSKLHTFPEILVTIKKIKTLYLSCTAIKTLPESIEKLVALEALYLKDCSELRQLPNLVCTNLKTLDLDGCKHLQEIRGIPPNIKEFFVYGCTSLTSCFIKLLSTQNFYSLRKLDLQCSENLEEIPDMSRVANLEELDVYCCKKLTKIDDSIGHLAKLRVLKAARCKKLDTFIVGGIKLISLQILNLVSCSKLHTFPKILVTMKMIKILDLSYTAIETLPESIEKLVAPEALYLKYCTELRQLPNLACRNLKILVLDDCEHLQEIGGILPSIEVFSVCGCTSLTSSFTRLLLKQYFYNLHELVLHGLNLKEVPNISGAVNLEILDVSYCKKLTKIDDSIGHLTKLRVLDAERCERLDTFIVGGIKLVSLEVLNLSYCYKLHTFPEISVIMENIKLLNLSQTTIETLPESIEKLASLEILDLSWCEELRELPNLTCCKLKILHLDECKQLQEIRGIPLNIEVFYALNCTSLSSRSTRLLLTQVLHETGKSMFILPGKEIPNWLHKYSTGSSVSFWVHKKFPKIALCAALPGYLFSAGSARFRMRINGTYEVVFRNLTIPHVETDHILLFDLGSQVLDFNINIIRDRLEEELNHVEVSWKGEGVMESRYQFEMCFGVYVYNYDSCMEDILFENPIPQKRIPVDVVHKICHSDLESSFVNIKDCKANNEEGSTKGSNMSRQQNNAAKATTQRLPLPLALQSTNEDGGDNDLALDYAALSGIRSIGPAGGRTTPARSPMVTCENYELSSNGESLTSDSMKREYQLAGQKDQRTVIDKGYDEIGSHYSKDLQQQQQISESSDIFKKAKGKDKIVYEGNDNEKKGRNTLEVTYQNHQLLSNCESLNCDPMIWEYQLTCQTGQSTINDEMGFHKIRVTCFDLCHYLVSLCSSSAAP